jgi:hypothetical protein
LLPPVVQTAEGNVARKLMGVLDHSPLVSGTMEMIKGGSWDLGVFPERTSPLTCKMYDYGPGFDREEIML